MPCSRSSCAGPTPDSCSSCGVAIGPGREDDFARGAYLNALAVAQQRRAACSAGASRARSNLRRSACVRSHTVRLARDTHRLQEGLGGAQTQTVALVDVEVADAGIVAAIEIFDARDPGLLRPRPRRRRGCPSATAGGSRAIRRSRRARFAVLARLAAMAAFMRAEIRQHVAPAPCIVTGDGRPAS